MAVHTYRLRSSVTRASSRSPRKLISTPSILQLKHIIGTTTTNPSGLSSCETTHSFAYCAGSVAVLATVQDVTITYKYYKARPTTTALVLDIDNTPTKRKEEERETWSARERIKATTCVAISPDGKVLAVGETGYNPRVLLFSTNASTEQPLSIITDHSIGVRSVAFSLDSKYLATLGDVNDGFLHVWAVNTKTGDVKLHSTNKCTTNICDMTWVGSNIVTVGTRHIKVWQLPTRTIQKRKSFMRLVDVECGASPGAVPLQGRNCLLGKMVDSTFTAISRVSDDVALVSTDEGYICKLNISENKAELSSTIDKSDSPIAAVKGQEAEREVVALECLFDRIVSVDSSGHLKMSHASLSPSHSGQVKGVQILPDNKSFFTWATNGEVRIWNIDGEMKRLEQCDDELRVVRYLPDQKLFVTGDGYGVLKLFEQNPWSTTQTLRGHGAEITDIAVLSSLVATCSRDRMVQLFYISESLELELLQTMDEHISAVQHVNFSDNGSKLLSCSTDRTVVVRDRMEGRVAYFSTRVITLKASPLSMCLTPQDPNILVVSTMDRHVVRIDIASGAVLEAFKVGDKETDDTSILNSICLTSQQGEDEFSVVVGYSSIDKSIRVYDLQKGNLLGRETGHTEGISDFAMIENKNDDETISRTIISTGLDSTIMIWALNPPFQQPLLTPLQELQAFDIPAELISTPPLRKILTKMDMTESPLRLKRQTSRLAISATTEQTQKSPSMQQANKSRLRRPPSVPTDLRGIGMATEQTCQMLRTYRKRLQYGRGEIEVEEILQELEATLKVVKQKQSKDVDQLAILLQKSKV